MPCQPIAAQIIVLPAGVAHIVASYALELCGEKSKIFAPNFLCMIVLEGFDFLACSLHSNIYAWDPHQGKFVFELKGHMDKVRSLVQTPNGCVASSSCDRTIKVWDFEKRACVLTIDVDRWADDSLFLAAPNGALIPFAEQRKTCMWDSSSGECLGEIDCTTKWAATILPNGHVATASEDGSIVIFDLANNKVVRVLNGHTDQVCSLLPISHKNALVSGAMDGTLRIWDLAGGPTVVCENAGNCFSLALLHDGRFVASSEERGVQVRDAVTGALMLRLKQSELNSFATLVVLHNNTLIVNNPYSMSLWV